MGMSLQRWEILNVFKKKDGVFYIQSSFFTLYIILNSLFSIATLDINILTIFKILKFIGVFGYYLIIADEIHRVLIYIQKVVCITSHQLHHLHGVTEMILDSY